MTNAIKLHYNIIVDFNLILTKHDLKTTQARISLLKLVEKQGRPVDSQFLIDTLQKGLRVDKVTVFRILNVLTEPLKIIEPSPSKTPLK